MAFLLDHLPPQLHLVIASRADPALPLARLRARGELVEIRAADLRFTPDEAAAYLTEAMGLHLTRAGRRRAGEPHRRLDRRAPAGRAVDAGPRRRRRLHRRLHRRRPLHRRLPGRGGPAAPARPGPTFLLQTSVLEPAQRPAVRRRHRPGGRQGHAGGARSGEPVRGPARRPPPVVPLPPPLRRRAARAAARRAARRRAGAAPAGQRVVRAVSGDRPRPSTTRWPPRTSTRAADLVELAAPVMRRDRQEATLRGWLEALPEELFATRPVLSMDYVGALMSTGDIEGRRGPPAGRRTVSRSRPEAAVVRRRGGVPPSSRPDRHAPGRPGTAAGDVSATETFATAGARRRTSGRPPRPGGGIGAAGARVLADRRSRSRPRRLRRGHGRAADGRAHRGRPRLRDHAGRHPDRPGPSRRRDAGLRAVDGAGRRPRRHRAARNGRHARGDERDPA